MLQKTRAALGRLNSRIARRWVCVLAAFSVVVVGVALWILRNPERWRAEPHHSERRTLVADPALIVLSRDAIQGGKLAGAIRVRNDGALPATVLRMARSCSCVEFAEVADVIIPPGALLTVPFSIGVPARGSMEQMVKIESDTNEPPVIVTIRVKDSATIPRIVNVIHRQPDILGESQEHVCSIVAAERKGSDPWLDDFTMTGGGFTVSAFTSAVGSEHDDHLERQYDVTIRWESSSRASRGSEQYGALRASPSGADDSVPITSLIAFVASPISPSVVLLNPDRRSECILFGRGVTATDGWDIANAAELPSWLKVAWDRAADPPCLRVGWPVAAGDAQHESVTIALCGPDGRKVNLPVVIAAE